MNSTDEGLEFSVSGMTCASCVRHVSKALERVSGVDSARVNLATERASIVSSAGTHVEPATLLDAIERAGYRASIVVDRARADDDDTIRRAAEMTHRKRTLAFALAFFVPTLALAMFAPTFPFEDLVLLALTLPVYVVVGWDFHRSALQKLRYGAANMDTLVSLGSSAAFGYSLYAAIARMPTYFETASAIVTLIYLGKYLEAAAKGKTDRAIRALLELRPERARLHRDDGTILEVALDHVRVGDALEIRAGERIGVDGRIVAGTSALDESSLTGEPIPREVAPGDDVAAGTLNGDGTLVVETRATGAGTGLARIVEIVRHAQGSMPPVQRLADRIAGVFVPIVLVIAAATLIGWLFTGHAFATSLVVAVAVLVVACPCALGLATPLAISVAVGVAAKRGLLVRDAEALERLGDVDTVVFDKTGTLTGGRPDVVAIRTRGANDPSDVLRIAATVESASAHPLARAIVRAFEASGSARAPSAESRTIRGRGLWAEVDGAPAYVGNAAFIESIGLQPSEIAGLDANATIAYVARERELLGAIELADRLRPESAAAVDALRARGIGLRIVSGDARGPVEIVARALGIERFDAAVSPEGKAEIVAALRAEGRRVAFVGDGINDAPALASATVGLAMGGGSDIALESAGIALLRGDPRAIAVGIALARATKRTIAQNLFWAFAYNVALVPLSAFGFVHPMLAAGAMGLSSLFVAGNSLRLRGRRFSDRAPAVSEAQR